MAECGFDVSVGIGRDNRGAFGHTVNLSFSRSFPTEIFTITSRAKGPKLRHETKDVLKRIHNEIDLDSKSISVNGNAGA